MKANAILKRDRTAKTIFGDYIDCRIDDYIDRKIYFFGVWEPRLTKYMMETIKPSDVVVDVGANIGYFTVLMSRLVTNDGVVLAIEASPSAFGRLQANIQRNECKNVVARDIAASDRKGEITLFHTEHGDKNTGSATILQERGVSALSSVPCDIFMNIVVTAVPIERIAFIKIDVEGAEGPILSEIISNKDRFASRFVVVSEISDENLHFIDEFKKYGFQCYYLDNDYSWEAYLNASGKTEVTLFPVEDKPKRPPTADLVFIYQRPGNNQNATVEVE